MPNQDYITLDGNEAVARVADQRQIRMQPHVGSGQATGSAVENID